MSDSPIPMILIIVAFFAGLGLGNLNANIGNEAEIITACEIRGNSDD